MKSVEILKQWRFKKLQISQNVDENLAQIDNAAIAEYLLGNILIKKWP